MRLGECFILCYGWRMTSLWHGYLIWHILLACYIISRRNTIIKRDLDTSATTAHFPRVAHLIALHSFDAFMRPRIDAYYIAVFENFETFKFVPGFCRSGGVISGLTWQPSITNYIIPHDRIAFVFVFRR